MFEIGVSLYWIYCSSCVYTGFIVQVVRLSVSEKYIVSKTTVSKIVISNQ